jgi:hypothetical protein
MEVGVEVRLALEARLTEVLLLQIALQVLLFTTLVVEVLVQITPQPAVWGAAHQPHHKKVVLVMAVLELQTLQRQDPEVLELPTLVVEEAVVAILVLVVLEATAVQVSSLLRSPTITMLLSQQA